MYLSDLHIDSFGIFRDQGLANIGPGLSLFLGANESGKSTLLEFVRWVLFGPGEKAPPPPLQGGRIGGRLRLVSNDGQIILVERGEGSSPPNIPLFEGLDRRGFERIFALGLSELQGFQVLDDEEQRGRLQAAGHGLGKVDLRKLRRSLEKEIRSSLTQRGTRAVVNEARGQLQELEDRLRQARELAALHARLAQEKKTLEGSEEARKRELAGLDTRLASLDQLRRAAEPWKRWQEAEQRLKRAGSTSDGGALVRELSNRELRAITRLPETGACLLALLFTSLGAGLFATGLLPFAGASALAMTGALTSGSLYLLLRRSRRRMIETREMRQLTLESHRYRSAFEALTEGDPDLRQEIEDLDEAGLEVAQEHLRGQRRRLLREAQLDQQRLGAISAEMRSICDGSGPDELLLEQQIQQRRLEKGMRRWATAVLSLDILDEAFRSFTEERTPRILERAGALLSQMVGEELRLVAEPGEPPRLESSGLVRRHPEAWSSGLGDQAYLATRLALAEELRRNRQPFPFLLDDVFVRLDPQRQARTLRCLLELATSRQILLLTSRPSLVEDLKNIVSEDSSLNPFACVVRLQLGVLSGPFEVHDCD